MTTLAFVLIAVLAGAIGGAAVAVWLVGGSSPTPTPLDRPGPPGPPGKPGADPDLDLIVARVTRQLEADMRAELARQFDGYLERARQRVSDETVRAWLSNRPIWTIEEVRGYVAEAQKRQRLDMLSDLITALTGMLGRKNGGK